MRSGAMKLIVSTAGKHELYDVAADPAEQRNLYPAGTAAAAVMEASMRQWISLIPKASLKLPPVTDQVELQRLKSLGYVQ